ncbi:LacI family transcriptional regulator [Leucobacter luti]|uniref:LacI family DNA-binding transcriptional regulator n=1 Tax=Leucobacter luti TaxID=340320 RepID=UPI00104BA9FC|nr:LacI family DNA-binding transcriptional regulator [Leucobacter luti]MCW2288151.1 LacI family transcriptional regulator [Leucobacter luti]TCK45687.1 LacI family transcriptional regulator [Leucobacter luti]
MAGRVDVARLAGVSPAVVSYVLNGSHPVAAGTRERVVAAIDELGYRPNALARSLATARTHTLGLLLPESANPYFARLSSAIEDAAFDAGFAVLLGNGSDNAARELGYIRAFLDRRVDGIIAVPGGEFLEGWRELESARVPAVSLDRLQQGINLPSVVVDNTGGASAATAHLIDHGRTRIACITGIAEVSSAQERMLGWRETLVAAGLPAAEHRLARADFSVEAGHSATLALLARDPEIDAIFAGSDTQAVGVLRALADLGLRAGQDVAIVSFDGTPLSDYTTPRLTTMAQPYAEIATEVVRMLLNLIEDPHQERSALHRVLHTTLVPRDTCGCGPAASAPQHAPPA